MPVLANLDSASSIESRAARRSALFSKANAIALAWSHSRFGEGSVWPIEVAMENIVAAIAAIRLYIEFPNSIER